jgi:hypothetical protein
MKADLSDEDGVIGILEKTKYADEHHAILKVLCGFYSASRYCLPAREFR